MPGSAMIGNLAVNLTMETAAFLRGANIAQKRMESFRGKMVGIGAKVAAVGASMSAGLTAPLVLFGQSAFKAASDAAELDSAFAQTFGKMTGSMDAWAKATGDAMGRSTREIKDAANTFGIFFNTAMPPGKAAQMSQTFAKLAEDLGSFYNVDTDTAIEKLRSGLAGEAEPLRAFGVFLNEAAVKAKAAQMGIVGVNGALTDQQKIAVRAALILEQTTKAQGDVARTSSGTANQIRASKAAWEELQITVGTKLLPALTPLIEKLGAILTAFTSLSPTTQTWVVGIAAAVAVLGPVTTAIGGLVAASGMLLPLLVKMGPALVIVRTALLGLMANPYVLAGAALITGIYLAWTKWDKIVAIAKAVYEGVKAWIGDKLTAVLNAVRRPIDAVTGAFRTMWDKVVGHSYVPDMVDGIAQHFGRLQEEMVKPAEVAAQQVMQAFGDIAGRAIDDFGTAIADAALGTKSLADSFADMAKSIIHDLIEMTARFLIFRALAGIFGGAGAGLNNAGGLPAGWGGANPSTGPIGMASGGSGIFGGFGGIDRNILSLNGSPIARVSRGERFSVSPANDTQPVTVIQHNNFAGGAVTRDDLARMHQVTVAAAQRAVGERQRRAG